MRKNSLKNETFEKVWEHFMSRYGAGCFCVGDTLEFERKIFQDDCYKALQPELQMKLKDMVDSQLAGDSIIMVADVAVNPLEQNVAKPSTITIAYSLGGGRYYDPITIPGCLSSCFKRIDNGANATNMVPPKYKVNYDERFSKTPIELDLKALEKKRTQGHVDSAFNVK